LGQLYLRGGYGIKPDYDLAKHYFQLASNQGEAEGWAGLGSLHALGLGVEQDNQTAIAYFKKAAQQVSKSIYFMLVIDFISDFTYKR
jgi:TPR repeat protein